MTDQVPPLQQPGATNGSQTGQIIASGPSKQPRRKKTIVTIMLIVALVVGGAAFSQTEMGRNLLVKMGLITLDRDEVPETAVENQLSHDALMAANEKGPQGAIDIYQAELDRASGDEARALLLIDLARTVWDSSDDPDNRAKALQYAEEAERLHSTPQSAAQLIDMHTQLGNTSEAERYKQVLADWVAREADSNPEGR